MNTASAALDFNSSAGKSGLAEQRERMAIIIARAIRERPQE